MSAPRFFASLALVWSMAAGADAQTLRSQLDGRWKLVSTEVVRADGARLPSPFFAPGSVAYLIYSSDGDMCVVFPAGDALNAYCGRYELNEAGRTVGHNIEIKDAPDADQQRVKDMGAAGNRNVSIVGDTLTLRRIDPRPGVKEETQIWTRDGD